MKKRKTIVKYPSRAKEICYHIVNSLLSGALVLLGAFTTSQEINLEGLFFASIMAGIVAITKFKDFWDSEKSEYTHTVFHFVG